MKQSNFKEIQGFLTFWLMYATQFDDSKTYARKKQEVMDHYSDYHDIKILIRRTEEKMLKSLQMNHFLKNKDVPTLYLYGLKEKEHEKLI